MTMRLCFLLMLATASLSAANVEQRLQQLENKVSEIQLLLEHMNRKSPRPTPEAAPPANDYRIRQGDSLWSIARRHNTTVAALESANPGIHPRRLTIGQTITIPGTPTHTNSAASPTSTYLVKKGDVMGRIAQNHGIPLAQLLNANPKVNPRRLRIGSTLAIPGRPQKAPAPARPTETKSGIPDSPTPRPAKPSPQKENPYLKALESAPPVTKKPAPTSPLPNLLEPKLITLDEDTRFSQIASTYNTTVAQLNELNHRELSPDQMIQAGSQIYIPGQ